MAATDLLANQRFASRVAALSTGAMLAQAFTTVGTVVTARLFAPEDFGLLALFTAVSLFFLPAVSGKYETAIMIPESDADAAELLVASCWLALVSCTLLSIGMLLFRKQIFALAGANSGNPIIWTVGAPLSLFVSGVAQIFGYWCARIKVFHQIASARIVTAVVTIAVQLVLFVTGPRAGQALVIGTIVGQAAGVFCLLRVSLRRPTLGIFAQRSWRSKAALLLEHRKFLLFGAPYSFVGGAGRQLIAVTLRTFAGLPVLGLFSVAMRTVYLPVSLVAGSIRPVFYQAVCDEMNPESMSLLVNRIVRVLMTFACPVLVFFCFNARALFALILGAKWADAGTYAALLAVVSFITVTISWMDRLFDAKGKQHIPLIWEILHTAATLSALVVGLIWLGRPILAVTVYVAVDLIFEAVWVKLAFTCGGIDLSELLKTLWCVARLSSVLSVLMLLCRVTSQPWQLILSSFVTCAAGAVLGFNYLHERAPVGAKPFAETV